MKKIMSLIIALALVSNTAIANPSVATTSHDQMIAKTFNEFRYKMTVAGDPTSAKFKEQAVNEFKARMIEIQTKGVSPAEIMDHMRANILDESTRRDFDALLRSMDSSKISNEEAGNLAMQFMASKYQQGASYSGGGRGGSALMAVIIGVIIVGVVTYLVRQNQTDTETTTNTRTNTETSTETNTITDTDTCTETQTQTDTCTYIYTAVDAQ